MVSSFADIVAFQLVMIPVVLVAFLLVRERRPWYAIVFLALFALDTAVLISPSILELHPEGLTWNWIGKFLSVTWVLLFVRLGPVSTEDCGLTLRQRPGTVTPAMGISAIVLAVIGVGTILSNGIQAPDPVLETLAYQATMPGIAEELTVRGVFLSVLILAFGESLQDEFEWTRATIFALLTTAFVFGLVHGLSFDDGVRFHIVDFTFPFMLGGIFAWLRLHTGSLLFPIILHNAVNVLVFSISVSV